MSSGLSKNRRRRLYIGEPSVSGFGSFACYTGIAPRRWKEKLFSLVVNPISMRRVFCAGPGANPARDTQSHSCRRIGSKPRKEIVWIADDESQRLFDEFPRKAPANLCPKRGNRGNIHPRPRLAIRKNPGHPPNHGRQTQGCEGSFFALP